MTANRLQDEKLHKAFTLKEKKKLSHRKQSQPGKKRHLRCKLEARLPVRYGFLCFFNPQTL